MGWRPSFSRALTRWFDQGELAAPAPILVAPVTPFPSDDADNASLVLMFQPAIPAQRAVFELTHVREFHVLAVACDLPLVWEAPFTGPSGFLAPDVLPAYSTHQPVGTGKAGTVGGAGAAPPLAAWELRDVIWPANTVHQFRATVLNAQAYFAAWVREP